MYHLCILFNCLRLAETRKSSVVCCLWRWRRCWSCQPCRISKENSAQTEDTEQFKSDPEPLLFLTSLYSSSVYSLLFTTVMIGSFWSLFVCWKVNMCFSSNVGINLLKPASLHWSWLNRKETLWPLVSPHMKPDQGKLTGRVFLVWSQQG